MTGQTNAVLPYQEQQSFGCTDHEQAELTLAVA